LSLLVTVLKNVPVIGQTYGFVKVAKIVYNSTDVLSATTQAVKGIIIDCTPPVIKYPVKCSILALSLIVCVTSAGPLSTSIAISVMKNVLVEELL
jgi:hypothetical protein